MISASARRRGLLGVIALATLTGLICGALSTGAIGLFPPRIASDDVNISAASTHVLLDTAPASIVHQHTYLLPAIVKRGEWLGNVVASRPLTDRIARRMGAPGKVAAAVRSTANVPLALSEPSSEQRADGIRRARLPYQIETQARQGTPVLDIYTQAPTTEAAEKLADTTVDVLEEYVDEVAAEDPSGKSGWLKLRRMGEARGGVVNAGIPLAITFLTFLVAFALVLATGLWALRRHRPAARTDPSLDEPADDDWPHTTRVLPWMLAGFLVLLWLVPFNEIQLTVQTPVDLKLDRLVLPFVALAWGVALAAGGRMAPRLRPTWIHAGVLAFIVWAIASVILNARQLNLSLELDDSLKRLPLLLSYSFLFLVAATAVRRTEVRAFLTFTLMLSVICAVGVIWEYRFQQNLFFMASDTLLPGFFSVGDSKTLAVDDIGRRLVRGPGALPLETVAMLSMALPIPLVRLMQIQSWRSRILPALGACLLLAAMFATYRKSALLAPVSVIATLAYFRRRELLKLAPLALVLVLLVHVLAPGAIGGTTNQFDPGRLGVTTVSDRTADYDAIRPEVWTHVLFGRGAGSYDHLTYRILDSEFLHRTIETGVLGLIVYVLMSLAVIFSASRTIASRDPRSAPHALAGAAAAVAFLVVSGLFDVLSFPHPVYIFLYMAGLTAVVIKGTPPRRMHGPQLQPLARRRGPREHAPERTLARAGASQ